MEQYDILMQAFLAGIAASFACALGAVPVAIPGVHIERHVGLAYGFAGGLMFSAAVYNLLLPGLTVGSGKLATGQVVQTIAGILAGSAFLWLINRYLTRHAKATDTPTELQHRRETLLFVAMCCHSIPEGVAVGVGYASAHHVPGIESLGPYIALAIGIHNIPEGLAVAIPMRAGGASLGRCAFAAFLTSLPQPVAAVPAALLVWLFAPLMAPLLGFAAGAMIYLVILEIIPDALEHQRPTRIAWMFVLGFCLMVLVQVML